MHFARRQARAVRRGNLGGGPARVRIRVAGDRCRSRQSRRIRHCSGPGSRHNRQARHDDCTGDHDRCEHDGQRQNTAASGVGPPIERRQPPSRGIRPCDELHGLTISSTHHPLASAQLRADMTRAPASTVRETVAHTSAPSFETLNSAPRAYSPGSSPRAAALAVCAAVDSNSTCVAAAVTAAMHSATTASAAGMAVTSSAAIAPSSSPSRVLLDRKRTAHHVGENLTHLIAAENHHQQAGESDSSHRCDDVLRCRRAFVVGQSFPHVVPLLLWFSACSATANSEEVGATRVWAS